MIDNLTEKDAVEKAYKMWVWMATETERQERIVSKDEYFGYIGSRNIPMHGCFLCEYSREKTNSMRRSVMCRACPVKWGTEDYGNEDCENDTFCEKADSPYAKWEDLREYATDELWQETAKYAKKCCKLACENFSIKYKTGGVFYELF